MIYDRRIAKRYAKAFLHEDTDPAIIDRMADEFRAIVDAFKSDRNIHEFFISPVTKRKVKLDAAGRIVEKLGFSPYTRSMLEVLIRKDRIDIIEAVAEELHDAADTANNRVRVKLTTASEPSVDDIKEISERIGSFFKRKTVVVRTIDPAIIGGFIIEGDGKKIDMSITGQLRHILSRV